MGLEGFERLGLRGDEVVEAGQAVGDALLLGCLVWNRYWNLFQNIDRYARLCLSSGVMVEVYKIQEIKQPIDCALAEGLSAAVPQTFPTDAVALGAVRGRDGGGIGDLGRVDLCD